MEKEKDLIRPFARHGHYTQLDNAIIDSVMPKLSGNEWKVLTFILRKTIGWNKEADGLAYSQMRDGTGISSNSTIQKAVNALVAKGLITCQTQNGLMSQYRINEAFTITENVKDTFTENVKDTFTENVNTKDINKNIYIEGEPIGNGRPIYPGSLDPHNTGHDSIMDHDDFPELLSALSYVCKTHYNPLAIPNPYHNAVRKMIKEKASKADIMAFKDWWVKNGHYAGKPALTSLLNEWANYQAGIDLAKKKAGQARKTTAAERLQERKRRYADS